MKDLWFMPPSFNIFTRGEKIKLVIWRITRSLFFYPSTPILNKWRILLLRLFGAKIGIGCNISPRAIIMCPWRLEMGNFSSIDDYSFIRNTGRVVIGDYVSIASQVTIVPGGHDIRSRGFENNATYVIIGNGCFIGACAYIGRSCTIGQFSVLGAHAIALKDIPENSIAVGFPAKVIGERIPKEEYIKFRYSM